MSDDTRKTIFDLHVRAQDTYVYYVLGLTATAIGFLVYHTIGEPVSYQHIPLVLSLGCWAWSMHRGFTFIKLKLGTQLTNYQILCLQQLNVYKGDTVTDPDRKAKLIQRMTDGMSIDRDGAQKAFNSQYRYLIAGIGFFFVWYAASMIF